MKHKRRKMLVNIIVLFVLIVCTPHIIVCEKQLNATNDTFIFNETESSVENKTFSSNLTAEENTTVTNECVKSNNSFLNEITSNRTHLTDKNDTIHCENNTAPTAVVNSTNSKFCLQVVLDKNEYSITDGWLQTIYDASYKFPKTSYVIDDDGDASLCYPFTKEFNECYPNIWQITTREYEHINGTKNILNKNTKAVYRLGDYIPKQQGIYVCIPKNALKYNKSVLHKVRQIIMLIGYALSFSALFMSLLVYLLVPMKQYDSRPLFCHMVSMCGAYFILLLYQMMGVNSSVPVWCYIIAVLHQFTFLAAFSWLNVVAFELWHRFRNNIAFQALPSKEMCCIFIYNSLYGWGVPAAIIAVSLSVEFMTDSPLKPSYIIICMMNDRAGKWLFFYGPIAIMLIVNFTFFILTVVNLHRVGQEIALANNKIHRQLLAMYFKLMFVMGISWIFEVLSWAVGPLPEYWIVTDLVNSLQGVFIFFIYCFKKSVLQNMKKKWPRCARLLRIRKLNLFKPRGNGNSFGSVTSTATVSSYVAEESYNMAVIK